MNELLAGHSSLNELLETAWEVRNRHFPSVIQFDYPEGTPAISLTGADCDLNCSHCGGHYLKGMLDKPKAEQKLARKPAKSCLISGGCNHQGTVDTGKEIAWVQNLREQLTGNQRINMHVGLVEGEQLTQVAQLADVVSFDIVGDDQTIREVYHINKTAYDYEQCYQELCKHVKVIPHICIGLRGGELGHELKALQMLKTNGVDALVFIVFIPTKGTHYENKQPPVLEQTVELLARARIMFPDIPISLGCMRPKGSYRAKLDYLSVLAGVNRLVIPTSPTKLLVKRKGLQVTLGEECCIL
ncbi:hypothetical protein BHF68_01710 [Desulfuribacillus alkaliarsenatis]|uniref:Radical SAM protein n=1 Tax=Desulfuribacillus alkaliarsenatis TaxID=766136 RepID=A0A1E5G6G0_9FIRM|nr:hypothetical protein BHF68_01710 [Desulfuribacillus alkaliarsenatis]